MFPTLVDHDSHGVIRFNSQCQQSITHQRGFPCSTPAFPRVLCYPVHTRDFNHLTSAITEPPILIVHFKAGHFRELGSSHCNSPSKSPCLGTRSQLPNHHRKMLHRHLVGAAGNPCQHFQTVCTSLVESGVQTFSGTLACIAQERVEIRNRVFASCLMPIEFVTQCDVHCTQWHLSLDTRVVHIDVT